MGFGGNVKGFVARYHKRSSSSTSSTIDSTSKDIEQDLYTSSLHQRMSSGSSLHSDTSSMKLARILGPEVFTGLSPTHTPRLSRQNSYSRKGYFQDVLIEEQDEVDTDAESLEHETSEEQYDQADSELENVINGYLREDCNLVPSSAVSKIEQVAKNPAIVLTPQSPDIDALSIAQFPEARASVEEDSQENLTLSRSLSLSRNGSIDFNEVCERLLDSLSSPLERPSYESQTTSSSESSVASSMSSQKIFTEPPSPLLHSDSSSCSSMVPAEKMAQAKSDLVADQIALEAKFKLAAARDALKKVKSNVATPSSAGSAGFAFTRYPTGPLRPMRSLSSDEKSDPYILTSSRPESLQPVRASRSYTSIDESSLRQNTPRSSRSSRVSNRDSNTIVPNKSEVRIGVAAPKNLSNLKRGGEAASGKPANHLMKTKSKGIYTPQGHITSIHEVLA